MRHGDDHDIAALRELGAVVYRVIARTNREAAAMNAKQHRALILAAESGCPDIEMQAVLAHSAERYVQIKLDQPRIVMTDIIGNLGRDRRVTEAIAHARPRRRRFRPLKAIRPGGGRPIGNAFELPNS